MAGNLTNYAETQLLGHITGVSFDAPILTQLALYTVAPGEAGGGTEVTGSGYLRQNIVWSAVSGSQSYNLTDIVFPISLASWGTVVSIAILDQDDNMLWYADLDTPTPVLSGQVFSINASALVLGLG